MDPPLSKMHKPIKVETVQKTSFQVIAMKVNFFFFTEIDNLVPTYSDKNLNLPQ